MTRRITRVAVVLGVLTVGAALSCRYLLPERFAVNAPLRHLLWGTPGETPDARTVSERIRAADGRSVSIWAVIPQARWLHRTEPGDLLVSVPAKGRVVLAARDADGDGAADGVRTLIDGLNRPHGLALHDGWLYVGETDAVGRVRFDAASGRTSGPFERVVTGLPGGGNHWTRTVGFGPESWLYVSIGSSCNVCEEEDPRRAAMLRFRPDGSGGETYASGLRNAVGFDWRPGTDELYATDNGRDLLGDDFPPCELNRIVRGGFYGWPYANGARVPDPDLGAGHAAEISSSIPPAHGFRAHTAPLGITFLRHQPEGSAWGGAALVALHGSWNRTRKDGYEVVSLHWNEDGSIREERAVWGFLEGEDVIGRPVDVAEAADGTVYVSDDYAGVVYRVGREAATAAAPAAEAPAPRGEPADGPVGDPTRGAALYEAHACYGCHEAGRAEAGVVPVPLEDLGERYDAAALADFFLAPTPPMPAFPFSDAERRALAAHLLSRD